MTADIKKGLESRVVLLCGRELAVRKEALESLLQGIGGDEFDREVIQADASPVGSWVAAASTIPFLSERRTVIVRNLHRANTPPDDAIPLLSSLTEHALLILVHEDDTSEKDTATAWKKTIEKVTFGGPKGAKAVVIEAKPLEAKAAEKILRERSQSAGKNLSGPAASMLMEMCGGSYSRAQDELEKLVLYAGSAQEITQNDVQAAVVPSREWNIFKLLDAVVAAQPGAALRQLRILVGSSLKAEDAANGNVVPMLSRQLRLMWQAKAVQLDGRPLASLEGELPNKNNLAKEKDYPRQRAVDAARKVSMESIERCLEETAEADARLKGQLASIDAMETLETLVLQCCEHMRMKVR